MKTQHKAKREESEDILRQLVTGDVEKDAGEFILYLVLTNMLWLKNFETSKVLIH